MIGSYKNLRADKQTYHLKNHTVNGKRLIPVAIQYGARVRNWDKVENWIFLLEGTREIYWKAMEGGVDYTPIAGTKIDMEKFYQLFADDHISRGEAVYLHYNRYELL